ncbi:hypothetical protein LCGC14_1709550 [marine sediment metagenome]|uniref:Uncharacterized protein n=1 Tax=marine sediment metagenome TaxID=412755 RepID=A0A0F9KFP1_9ZZZZ
MKKIIAALLILNILAVLVFLPVLPGLRNCRDIAFATQEHFNRMGIQADVVSVEIAGAGGYIQPHAITLVHLGWFSVAYDNGKPKLSLDYIKKFRWDKVVVDRRL